MDLIDKINKAVGPEDDRAVSHCLQTGSTQRTAGRNSHIRRSASFADELEVSNSPTVWRTHPWSAWHRAPPAASDLTGGECPPDPLPPAPPRLDSPPWPWFCRAGVLPLPAARSPIAWSSPAPRSSTLVLSPSARRFVLLTSQQPGTRAPPTSRRLPALARGVLAPRTKVSRPPFPPPNPTAQP